jgi:hypothetical protein
VKSNRPDLAFSARITAIIGNPAEKSFITFFGTPAKFRGILAKDGADSIHEERQIRYAPQLSTEAFEFGVE